MPNGSLLSRSRFKSFSCFLFITNNVHSHLGLGAYQGILTWFSSALNLVSLSVSSAYVWYIASLQVTCLHLKSKQGLTPPCSSFIFKNINTQLSHGKAHTTLDKRDKQTSTWYPLRARLSKHSILLLYGVINNSRYRRRNNTYIVI